MVPVSPGSLMLSRTARHVTKRNTTKHTVGIDFELSMAFPKSNRPEMTINATNIRAENDFGIL